MTLLQDGWSSVKNDPIIATSIYTGEKTFLLNAVDCQSNSKTAEYCSELAMQAIKLVEERYNKKVFAICTDNEHKMTKMRGILSEKFPGIITYGCSTHYVNLLENEVTPNTIIKQVVEVQKFFRNHHQPHGWLKEKGGHMPQLPNSTRWNSQEACVTTFINNYHTYRAIIAEHSSNVPPNITKILDNVAIYKNAGDLLKHLTTVSSILDRLQADTTNIAEAVELWFDLRDSDDLQPYRAEIERRMDQALQPIHYLANMMSPKFKGQRLSSTQETEAEEWITAHHDDWITYVLAFKIEDSTFYPTAMFQAGITGAFSEPKWWSQVLPQDICEFMMCVSNCPASSASTERIFSTFGIVWTELRNQLSLEKVEKLVKVYRFLRAKDDDK